MDVVVWNLDARYRPELEVDLEIDDAPDEIPGRHHARRSLELEVELQMTAHATAKPIDDLFADAWFIADDDLS